MIRVTREQTEEAIRHPNGVPCQGEGTEQSFILMDAEVVRRMRNTLYQKDLDKSIATGIADMEAGRMLSARDADDHIRRECGFPSRTDS